MKVIILAALVTLALAAEEYPAYPKAHPEAYPHPAAYPKEYEYPAVPYDFAYQVQDDPTYNNHGRQESSDGKIVTGSYRVALPDGRTQIVTYKADEYGYQSDIKYEGEAHYPEYHEPAYPKAKPAYHEPAYPKAKPAYPEPAYPKVAHPEPAYPKAKPAYSEPAYPKA